MRKTIIINIIIILVLVAIVAAARQNIGGAWTSGNLLFIDSGKKHRDSALVGWYPVEEWELETCTRDITASFKIENQAESGIFSQNNLIIDTTITIQAFQMNYDENSNYKEYEIAWYIQPFNDAVNYEVQYYADDWNSFNPPLTKEASPTYGDRGYYTWSGDYNISKVRLIAGSNVLEVQVVQE